MGRQIQDLTHGLESARRTVDDASSGNLPDAPDADPLTRLPGRRSAQEALSRANASPAKRYALLFVVDKVHAVNLRLGYGVGDQMPPPPTTSSSFESAALASSCCHRRPSPCAPG